MEILPLIIALAIMVVMIAAMWKTFQKAGQPGWACIVPIYNYYILTKMAEKPGWWTVLMILPYVNIIFLIWCYNRIAKRFGKGVGTTILMLFAIGWLILGFGSAEYKAEGAVEGAGGDALDSDM